MIGQLSTSVIFHMMVKDGKNPNDPATSYSTFVLTLAQGYSTTSASSVRAFLAYQNLL